MKKSILMMISLLLVMSMFLAACGGNDNAEKNNQNTDNTTDNSTDNNGETSEPKEGGVLKYALDSEFEGLLNWNFYESSTDADVIGFFDTSLIDVDENLQYQPGIASWVTEDNKTYTFTFLEGVKWHNGEELTVDDWIYSLEVVAHKDYTGARYVNVKNIVGVPAYKEGTVDTISGIEKVDNYTVKISFDKARVNNLENLWTYAMPKKEFEGVAIADMASSAQVRQTPVGLGPFKVKKIVPGEYVEMVRHDDYWRGKPKLDGVIVKVIDSSLTMGALKNEEVDVMGVHPTYLQELNGLTNVTAETVPGLAYYYVGFKLGHWDAKANDGQGANVMDKPKYQDQKLRAAMYHAINRQEWVDAFFNGLGTPIEAPVPSTHWISAPDSELPNQYEYDPEKAKSLLAEAGYKDVDGDGFVEDPNGKPFVVKFGHYATSNPTFEARARAMLQYWNDIGLNAQFATGGLIDVNLYYEMLETDEEELEVFYGGWGTGTDPDPSGLWASYALWNYPRWVNEESDQLLEDALDVDVVGTDTEKRKDLYVEWQKLFNQEIPALIIMELKDLYAVNQKVKGVVITPAGLDDLHNWYMTE